MEKEEMIERLKRKIEEYGQCSRAKGCVETMAQTRKAMQKEDDFKYYEGQVKDMEKIWPYCSTLLRKCLILSQKGNRPWTNYLKVLTCFLIMSEI